MGGWYHATKYAVEAFSDALWMEAKQFGIDVILIESGGIKTDWGNIAADHPAALRVALMKRPCSRSLKGWNNNGNMMSKPQVVVKETVKVVNMRLPKPRYLIGIGICSRHFANASIRLYHDERFLNQKTSLLN